MMQHKSEILKIIEAGLEGDRTKLIAYANLLVGKCSDDERFQTAIIDRITGEYKTRGIIHALAVKQEGGMPFPPKVKTLGISGNDL